MTTQDQARIELLTTEKHRLEQKNIELTREVERMERREAGGPTRAEAAKAGQRRSRLHQLRGLLRGARGIADELGIPWREVLTGMIRTLERMLAEEGT